MSKNLTKRAFLASVMALLLCVSSLMGTTYAWFTDSVTSSNNVITSGSLDVELYYQNSETNDWTEVTDQTNIFKKDTLWEPGHVEVITLKVANEGTLALKYQLGINVDGNETPATNINGGKYTLSDYIEFGVVDGEHTFANREDAIAAIGDSKKINEGYTATSSLDAGKAAIVTLVVYMPTTVGNEANPAKDSAPSINLGIKLLATQYTAENDAFGPDYDAGAEFVDIAYTVAGDNAALADVLETINTAKEKNVLVQLDQDVEWETGAAHGSTPWVDENAVVENLIIDAKGATITATGDGVGPIRMANGGTLTIKNATIKDNSASYAEDSWEFGYLEFAGNLVFENVDFVNAIMLGGENATFKNCTFNSNKDNEYAVWVDNGNASFLNCTFSGARGLKTHEAYGSEVGTITVDACIFDSLTKKPGMAIGDVNADTTIIIKNSDFISCQAGDQGKYIYESDTDVATFKFDCSQNNEIIKSADLTITTKEQLFAFANDVNVNGNSYAGKLVALGADIDLENEEWTPIGQTGGNGAATYFQGMFDGKGYTIKNLKITNSTYDEGRNYAAGFFGFIDNADAQIVNLNVDGANVNGHHWTGVIAGYLSGKISGCTVTNATVSCTHANDDACGDKAGVIVGYVNTGVVTANTAMNCTVSAGRDAGQIAGTAKATYVYGNTSINVTVTAAGNCTGASINNAEIGRLN